MSAGQRGFWDVEERLRELTARGDPLEKLAATVDFEIFQADLEEALGPLDRSKGGRPPFDPVLEFRMLVLQAMHGLSLDQTEFLVSDRLNWMRFCGLGPGDAVLDANTLWDFREVLIAAGALDALIGGVQVKVHTKGGGRRERGMDDMFGGLAGDPGRARERADFAQGCVDRINERLRELCKEREKLQTGDGRSLVVVKNALVEQAFAKLGLTLERAQGRASTVRNGEAYAAGQRAGDRASFGRPVNGGGSAEPRAIAGR